jgi:putative ABC transport system permease protein
MLKSVEYTTAMQVGTLSHGGFKRLTPAEADLVKDHHLIKSYGMSTIVGTVEDERLFRRSIEVRTMDAQYMSESFMPLTGNRPKDGQEIIVDSMVLDMLNLPHELGQEITFGLKIDDKLIDEQFEVVGIYEGSNLMMASYIVVSEEFKDRYTSDIIGPDMNGAVNLTVNFDSKYHLYEKLNLILLDNKLDPEIVQIGVNWAYKTELSQLNPSDIMSYMIFIMMLMFSGYLIIYNVYLISITKDINYYGLLKTIGSTSKQIKAIVYKQAMVLYMISLPIGLSLGYLLGVLLVPFVLTTLNITAYETSIHVSIFILATLLTGITVLISCRKPAKIASKVTPIEGIRTVDRTYRKKKSKKNKSKLHHLAWKNLFRIRKKALLVILSLMLSLLILNMVAVQVDNFDEKEFLSNMINSDYIVGPAKLFSLRYRNESIPVSLLEELDTSSLEIHKFTRFEEQVTMSEEIKNIVINGLSEVDASNGSEFRARNGLLSLECYSADDYFLDHLASLVTEGEIPLELNDNQIILDDHFFGHSGMMETPYKIGDILDVEGHSYEIVAFVSELPMYLYDQSFSQYGLQGFVSRESENVMTLMINGELDKDDILRRYPSLEVKSRQDYIDQIQGYINMLKIVGFTLSSILMMIGLLNFINMISTSIIVRKREFAMMQSIGMTSKQLRMMLFLEGLFIVVIATVGSMIVSMPLSYLITNKFELHYLLSYVFLSLLYTLIVYCITEIAYKLLTSQSIVSRLNII